MIAALLLAGAAIPSTPDLGKAEGQCRANESGPAFLVDVKGLKDRQGRLKLELYPANDADFLADDNILIASGKPGFDLVASGFAANGYAEHSPGGYSLYAAAVCEVVMTYMFLLIIIGSTDKRATVGFAGIAIGLGLTLIHLISIPVTNTSVNPARSTGPALFVGGWALSQLWLFWVAPIVGALLAGFTYRWLGAEPHPR